MSAEWVEWSWSGVFSLSVPAEWQVTQDEGLIELVPPDAVGALHITVLRRRRAGPVRSGEARVLVEDFARKQGVPELSANEREGRGRFVASVGFQTTDEEGQYVWEVQSSVWEDRALVASLCHGPKALEFRSQGLQVLASIRR